MTELLIVLKATLLQLLGLTATRLAGRWRGSRRISRRSVSDALGSTKRIPFAELSELRKRLG
jgi:hypothetical protein